MEEMQKARVFRNGRSQAVRIPAKFRFTTDEVFVRQGSQAGELILSQTPSWEKVFADLDRAGIPRDFLSERNQGMPQERDDL